MDIEQNRKYNYVFLASYKDFFKFSYQEMLNDRMIKLFFGKDDLLKWRGNRLADLHVHNRFLSKIPGKSIWYKLALSKIFFENDKPICFVWFKQFDAFIENTVQSYLKKKFPKAKHIYCYTDVLDIEDKKTDFLRKKMDLITVYDPVWAKDKELLFVPNIYPTVIKKDVPIESDLYFIGNDKNSRGDRLCEIAQMAKENGVKSDFWIQKNQVDEAFTKKCQEIGVHDISGRKIPYQEVLQKVQGTNCLVELKVDARNGCSLRIQEAVVLGKKILTNNEAVWSMPCCVNSPWISFFEDAEDIDWNFVKRKDEVDYGYCGEYSYLEWIKTIESNL